MFVTTRDPRDPKFGVFYFDHYQAADPNFVDLKDYWRNLVWVSTKSHKGFIPTARGDGSAKTIPWDRVKKNPANEWWDFDYTYWGAVQEADR
jgi:hypothetical protein